MSGRGGGPGGDTGVQNERTALAWQRTALSLAAAEAALARLTYDRAPVLSTVSLVVVLPLTAWVFAASRRRYAAHGHRTHARHRGRADAPARPGGTSAAVLAAVVALMALTELVAMLSGRPAG